MIDRDRSLDTLLDLDGEVFVIDDGGHWVKFIVTRVPETEERPHGLSYSLTLHAKSGERLVGFDNAHRVAAQRGPAARSRKAAHDHKHRRRTVRPYDYQDAASLLTDFWIEVYAVLAERGVDHD
ncbi:MAG TPA: DUF6516 family protein [Caulobacteraceae bacterium]|nr:DUF6516 family protein [Caulobacteraceae bacterium]